jgi:hypothetical protein
VVRKPLVCSQLQAPSSQDKQRPVALQAGIVELGVRSLLVSVCLAVTTIIAGCGGSSRSVMGGGTTNNVQAIAVNGGPVAGQLYPNGAFTSVTVCAPSSSTCQTVDGVLVDTGSFGLRILGSAIASLNLPQVTSGGKNVFNCVSFVDGSFLWGPVAQADVKMAGEVASKIGIHIVEDPAGFAVPTACSNGGVDEDNQTALGANGILGVGMEPQDCGTACDPSAGGTAPPVYFSCSSNGNCQTAFLPVAQQITNPVVGFAQDNNGVLIQLPTVSGAAATLTGSMIFGIGTQGNNKIGSATVFTVNNSDNFTTNFSQQSLTQSFIDSGSNGLFFPDGAIPDCPKTSNAPGFFCPASTLNLSAQNVGMNSAQNTVNFSVGNAVTLFQTDGSDSAISQIAGPSFPTGCSGSCGFDWGLPFFYGRSVFTAIDGQMPPSGAPATPWWAY